MPAAEVLLACARPAELSAADVQELALTLGDAECAQARRFRFEADRHAFVVARALLRALAADPCGMTPQELDLRHDAKGRPYIAQAPRLHVSLSRSRDAVAAAVTSAAPVGVDIECMAQDRVDASMLEAFVVPREPVTQRQLLSQWTALEAFWKAWGTGLADGQPRIACWARGASRFDVVLEHGTVSAGRGAIVHAYDDCAFAVVLRAPADPDFVLKRTNCRSAMDIQQLSRAVRPLNAFLPPGMTLWRV